MIQDPIQQWYKTHPKKYKTIPIGEIRVTLVVMHGPLIVVAQATP